MKILLFFKVAIIYIVILSITSCEDSFLEVVPKTEYAEGIVWTDPALVQTYLNNMYRNIDDPHSQRRPAVYCDEAHRGGHADSKQFNASLWTPDRIRGWDHSRGQYLLMWDPLYKQVRRANLALENIDRMNAEQALIDKYKGEVYFMRAWAYFSLARMFGGVPIVERTFRLDDDFELPRNSFEDVIEFIISDLDMAAGLLSSSGSEDLARPTKGAALALKSRVLIAAASDLYNTTIFSGYANPELIGYTDKSNGKRTERWQRAKDAAKAVMDLQIYSLWQGSNDSVSLNFANYFTSIINRDEDILNRYMNYIGEYFNNMGYWMIGAGYSGQLNTMPIGQMVDRYEMRDGTKFDWNNPDHASAPYKNRDPRLYSSVLYHGAHWRPRPLALQPFDPDGIIQIGYKEVWNEATSKVELKSQLDATVYGSVNTGYINRKFLNPAYDHSSEYQPVTFRYLRYTEVIFNYIEACIELEQNEEARTYLNMIRRRADMPDITESGDELRKRFRNEKKVEMFMEDQRFWDIRRWVIGPEAQTPTEIVEVRYKLLPDNTTSTVPTFISKEKDEIPKRAWLDKVYYFPIMRTEMNRNSKLIQNPGYD